MTTDYSKMPRSIVRKELTIQAIVASDNLLEGAQRLIRIAVTEPYGDESMQRKFQLLLALDQMMEEAAKRLAEVRAIIVRLKDEVQ